MTAVVKSLRSLAARATMSDKDVRTLLTKDHEEALDLAKQLANATSAATRKTLLAKLRPALVAHSRAEEAQVYEALMKLTDEDSNRIGNEGYVEHHLVDELLESLDHGDAATQRWAAQAKVLHELLEHHIDEEHSEMYADLGRNFDTAQLEDMGRRFVSAKQQIVS